MVVVIRKWWENFKKKKKIVEMWHSEKMAKIEKKANVIKNNGDKNYKCWRHNFRTFSQSFSKNTKKEIALIIFFGKNN